MGSRSYKCRVIAQKVNPIHMDVVINKENIVAMNRNGRGYKRDPKHYSEEYQEI